MLPQRNISDIAVHAPSKRVFVCQFILHMRSDVMAGAQDRKNKTLKVPQCHRGVIFCCGDIAPGKAVAR